jgi:predicted hotdog family 3-hydroxylacyl-ACP dehydratase
MDPSSIPVSELLPHGPEMTVIDRLTDYDATKSIAVVVITPQSAFFEKTGVPGWVGIEYMAQTVAAHVGFEARLRGEPPAIGFLLGTRDYETKVAEFSLGSTLMISVEPLLMGSGVGAFNCSIQANSVLATAVVNTYRPHDDEIARIRARLVQS